MNMRVWIAVALALGACRHEDKAPPPQGSAAKTTEPSPTPAPAPTAPDPWTVTADEPDAPTYGERHKLAEAACPKVTGPYFYEIEKDGKTSYILGTRHISVPLAKFPPVVSDRLHHAQLAVFEVAPDDDSHVERPELDIAKELGPDLWKHYSELIGATQAETLAHSRPSTALLTMMVLYEDVSAFLDKQIQDEVATAHIPARGLETSLFQDNLLDELLDVRMLRAAVKGTKDRHKLEEQSTKDLRKYCAGTDDEPGMDADERKDLLDQGYTVAELDAMDDKLVFRRNASWIPKLEQLFAQGNVFVAVGADHLRGERGVIALLAKRGFHTRRITE